MEETMRVLTITITELLRLTRKELCDLAAQFTAALSHYPAGSPEHTAALTTLRNIRFVLARRDPAPG
jgi:hypothetical protein